MHGTSETDAESSELGTRKVFPVVKIAVIDFSAGTARRRKPLNPVLRRRKPVLKRNTKDNKPRVLSNVFNTFRHKYWHQAQAGQAKSSFVFERVLQGQTHGIVSNFSGTVHRSFN